MIGLGESNVIPIQESDEKIIAKILEGDDSAVAAGGGQTTQCGICLKEIIRTGTKPIILKECHHVFCFGCLKQWIDYQTNATITTTAPSSEGNASSPITCPLCRQEIPDIRRIPIENALNLLGQANILKLSDPDKCRSLCGQAEEQISRLVEEENEKGSGSNNGTTFKQSHLAQRVQLAYIQGEIALLTADYEKAIAVFKSTAKLLLHPVKANQKLSKLMEKIDSIRHSDDPEQQDICEQLLDEAQRMLQIDRAEPKQYVSMVLMIGRAQRLAKKWTDAKKTYQDLASEWMMDDKATTPQQQREIFTSMSECAYHLGNYDVAIDIGEGAIQMNRYYPWSHKFVALALKSRGDLPGAKQVAAEAVIYETPWDDQHKIEVQTWFRETFF